MISHLSPKLKTISVIIAPQPRGIGDASSQIRYVYSVYSTEGVLLMESDPNSANEFYIDKWIEAIQAVEDNK